MNNELDPKIQSLIKEHRETQHRVVELTKKRNAWLVKSRQQGFSYKKLSLEFGISEKRIRQIISRSQGYGKISLSSGN